MNGGKKLPSVDGPQSSNGHLHQRVPPSDPGVATAAAAAQGEPTEKRDVFPPGQRVGAMAAMGAWAYDALARRPAAQAHVQEAAEGQPKETRKDGSENANHTRDEYTVRINRRVGSSFPTLSIEKRKGWKRSKAVALAIPSYNPIGP